MVSSSILLKKFWAGIAGFILLSRENLCFLRESSAGRLQCRPGAQPCGGALAWRAQALPPVPSTTHKHCVFKHTYSGNSRLLLYVKEQLYDVTSTDLGSLSVSACGLVKGPLDLEPGNASSEAVPATRSSDSEFRVEPRFFSPENGLYQEAL